jgi:arsenate reductase (thioredoxin)
MMQPALYFAYGSNLEPVQMAARAPGHRVVGRAVLRDHELRFRGYGRDWAGAVATIEPAPGHDVHGVVFAITADHYRSLDGYEGYDGEGAATNLYDRIPARVEMEDGDAVEVLTYRMRPAPEGAPSRRYRDAILIGMRQHGLPAGAIAALERVTVAEDLPHVLFVCIENSNRSQMAEGFARALGGTRVAAYSAGSRPSGQVNARAIAFMRERGVDLGEQRSKGLDDLPEGTWDAVVTMGCGDACPHLPARRRLDWDLPDPKLLDDDGFRAVRDRIEGLVRELVATVGAA